MQFRNYNLSGKKLYQLMKVEWDLDFNMTEARDISLQQLGLSLLEVNWFLNKLEWNYGLEIGEGEISMLLSTEDFIRTVLARVSEPKVSA